MRFRAGIVAATVLVLLVTCGRAQAAFNELAIAGKSGTLGLGGDLTTNIVPQVNLRAGVQWLGFDFDYEFDDIDYSVDLELLNPLVMVDWYPFNGSFRVSGGVLFNNSEIDLRGRPHEPVEIGGSIYTPDQIGSLRGTVDFDRVAPYIGIGWGNALDREKRWGLVTDLGIAFIGSPNVSLSATGPIAGNAMFQQDLASEEREVEDDIANLRIYPVLSISLFYRF